MIVLRIAVLAAALAACSSPESTRARGGGPGADTGNRGEVVRMHEGSKPYADTPQLVTNANVPVGSAQHAREASRR